MVRIVSDSTCDLSHELISRYGIKIIPLYVRLGDEEYLDGVNVTPKDIYDWSDANQQTPKTAAPSVADISNILSGFPGDDIIIFTISSSMSACNNNCRLAAENLGISNRCHVIDSENLSTGIGHLVVKAAEMAEENMPVENILNYILKMRSRVRASFVVDTLTYLHRGGRCSSVAALVGTALKLHPRIAVIDGTMQAEKKYRGLPKKYVLDYVKDMEKDLLAADPKRVFITHSQCDKEIVKEVRKYLEGLNVFEQIIETNAGSVISSHCGPGTLGVLFVSKE